MEHFLKALINKQQITKCHVVGEHKADIYRLQMRLLVRLQVLHFNCVACLPLQFAICSGEINEASCCNYASNKVKKDTKILRIIFLYTIFTELLQGCLWIKGELKVLFFFSKLAVMYHIDILIKITMTLIDKSSAINIF